MSWGNWGWGGDELIQPVLETQIWENLRLCGETEKVRWEVRGGRERPGGVDHSQALSCLIVMGAAVTD